MLVASEGLARFLTRWMRRRGSSTSAPVKPHSRVAAQRRSSGILVAIQGIAGLAISACSSPINLDIRCRIGRARRTARWRKNSGHHIYMTARTATRSRIAEARRCEGDSATAPNSKSMSDLFPTRRNGFDGRRRRRPRQYLSFPFTLLMGKRRLQAGFRHSRRFGDAMPSPR